MLTSVTLKIFDSQCGERHGVRCLCEGRDVWLLGASQFIVERENKKE